LAPDVVHGWSEERGKVGYIQLVERWELFPKRGSMIDL